jgi:KDO2-lipid IV(A) lauroyltransferase
MFLLENPEVLEQLYSKNKDIIAVLGHYNNWELLTALPLLTKYRCISIYRPLKNKYFDRFIYDLRSKYGMVLTPTASIMRELLSSRSSDTRTLSCFLADQTPAKDDIHYWTGFLNQETAVYLGAEKIASKYNMAVVFFNYSKIKRGVYNLKIEILFEETRGLPEHLITDTHVKRLEELIYSAPEYWVWSHRRWKHKKPPVN